MSDRPLDARDMVKVEKARSVIVRFARKEMFMDLADQDWPQLEDFIEAAIIHEAILPIRRRALREAGGKDK